MPTSLVQGPEACNKGFVVMSDGWFSEYLFQIVAPRRFVAAHLLDVYDHGHVITLPPWDVLGQSLSLFLSLFLSVARCLSWKASSLMPRGRLSRILRLGGRSLALRNALCIHPLLSSCVYSKLRVW